MNTKIIFSGLIGAAIGATVSYFITKNYYKKLADEEIKSVKDVFIKEQPVVKEAEIPEVEDPGNMDIKAYAEMIQKKKKTNYATPVKAVEVEEKKDPVRIIPYSEYLDYNWDNETLYLYTDGTLADGNDAEVGYYTDNSAFPKGWKDSFDMYDPEDDTSLYIINEKEEKYYEIIKMATAFGEDEVDDV